MMPGPNPMNPKFHTVTARRFFCRRRAREVNQAEVCECPYYFGKAMGPYRGDHKQFCDFQPGRDAVSFGLPPLRGRYWWS